MGEPPQLHVGQLFPKRERLTFVSLLHRCYLRPALYLANCGRMIRLQTAVLPKSVPRPIPETLAFSLIRGTKRPLISHKHRR